MFTECSDAVLTYRGRTPLLMEFTKWGKNLTVQRFSHTGMQPFHEQMKA